MQVSKHGDIANWMIPVSQSDILFTTDLLHIKQLTYVQCNRTLVMTMLQVFPQSVSNVLKNVLIKNL